MDILENIVIADLTTFKIGGKVRYLFKPTSIDDILTSLRFLKEHKLPYFVLGEGSNVLVGSRDYEGGVISMLSLDKIILKDFQIKAEAGVLNNNLSLYAYEHDIGGFEFLYRMPGSIGGSTLMNAKAFDSSMSDIILEVKTIDSSLKIKTFYPNEIDFGYKKSLFQNGNYIIVEVLFKTDKSNTAKIKAKMDSNEKKRLATRQYDYPSAGCIFKNNYKIGISTGKILDELGLKGVRRGNAEIYKHHSNFIINTGDATSDDVTQLIKMIKKRTKEEKQIDLECEINFHGSF